MNLKPMQSYNNTTSKVPVSQYSVRKDEKPFDVFLIREGEISLVGIKNSALVDPETQRMAKSCLVEPSMVMGPYVTYQTTDEEYIISFEQLDKIAVATLWSQFTDRATLTYPFLRIHNGQEQVQPIEYWSERAKKPELLDDDEIFMRRIVGDYLQNQLEAGAIIYDPACSSGAFLESMKAFCPTSFTIGQDCNPDMVTLAKQKVDKAVQANSIGPVVDADSVDAVVCRFLNLDVVTSQDARELFQAISGTLKSGGLMIVLGHTPILLSPDWMLTQGFRFRRGVGKSDFSQGIFQFYVLEKL
jgi:isonocardicin synthase